MSSELQQLASRTNGAKSHGPVTEEGKQTSSQNRRTHGLLSKMVVLPGESQEEFDELLASFLEEHQPETPTERTLIENMAAARWRQERVQTLENAAMANQMRNPRYEEGREAEDFGTQAYVAFHTLTNDSHSFELLSRYEVRFERRFRAALMTFLKLRAARQKAEPRREHASETAATAQLHIVPAAASGSNGNPRIQRVPAPAEARRDANPGPEPSHGNTPQPGIYFR